MPLYYVARDLVLFNVLKAHPCLGAHVCPPSHTLLTAATCTGCVHLPLKGGAKVR